MKTAWELWRQSELLGVLTLYKVDQPFFYCRFEPSLEFEKWREKFETLSNMSDAGRWEEVEEIDEELSSGLKLVDHTNGQEIDDLLLHIFGDEAWFRY